MCSGVRRTSPRSEVKAPWIRVLSDSNKPLSYGRLTGCRKPEVAYNRSNDERVHAGSSWWRSGFVAVRRAWLRRLIAQNLGTLGTGVAGESTVQTPGKFVPPTGPAPRLPNGKVDFSGVWDHPYVPDMSNSNARNPVAPEGCRATALHAGRAREHQGVRPREERRLHRHVHAVWTDAVGERAVSVPDHAERQVPHVPLRAEQLVLYRPVQERALHRIRTRRGSASRSRNGRATPSSSTRSASTGSRDSIPRATRTATSCTWCRR